MFKITVKNNNQVKILNANLNDNLLDVLRKNNFYINASCGGNGTCKKCKVKYLNDEILSCQTMINQDMTIELLSNVYHGLEDSIKGLYNIEKQTGYGIAIDLGTTTIAAYLINLETGEEIDSTSTLNLQSSYGADVITRINACNEGKLVQLHAIIVRQFNDIIAYFKNKFTIETIEKLTVAANTTMLHILGNIDPSSMGVYPYTPVFLDSKEFLGNDLDIDANHVLFLPSISSFVGSDLVAGIIATRLTEEEGNILLVDIGTNGEIILKTNSSLYATSTAAGPAFEGARIEFGMGGIRGAISKFVLKNYNLENQTIADEAKGICGSGLVDLISILVNEGIIDETGSFNHDVESPLIKHLIDDKFYFYQSLYLTQKDIREFQLAKSAIISGILSLLDEAKLNVNNIDKVYLAGGFGFYLNIENAVNIGLLPKALKDKIIPVGNSSGLGAKMVLCNPHYLLDCIRIAKNVKVIELANNIKFTNYFVENMMFN